MNLPADAPAAAGAAPGSSESPTARRIRALLVQRLHPAALQILDQSAAHAGHAGAGGKGHYHVRIVSVRFEGLSLLQRHRLVNQTLAALFDSELHALALETHTPDEIRNTST